jgi:branched-chain amino acid transport system substrate-binding protein
MTRGGLRVTNFLKKRSIVILACFAVIFTLMSSFLLAGCSSQQSSSAKTVKVAFIGPLTGPDASEVVGPKNCFQLAVDQANASGKLPYQIQTVFYDDASNAGTAANAAQKIVSDPDVIAVTGFFNSAPCAATIPIFKNAGIPLVIWGAISKDLTQAANMPYVTRVVPTTFQEIQPMAAMATQQMGYKKWAIITSTSTYGQDTMAGFKAGIQGVPGVQIVSEDSIADGTTDFRPVVSKLKNEDIDAVFFGDNMTEAALCVRQMKELGITNVLLAGTSALTDPAYLKAAGAATEGMIVSQSGEDPSKLPNGQAFISAYNAKYAAGSYGSYGEYAYDSTNIIVSALESLGANPDPKALATKIAGISYDGLLGTTTFDSNGQTTDKLTTIMVVQDGQFIDWNTSQYKTGERKLPPA